MGYVEPGILAGKRELKMPLAVGERSKTIVGGIDQGSCDRFTRKAIDNGAVNSLCLTGLHPLRLGSQWDRGTRK